MTRSRLYAFMLMVCAFAQPASAETVRVGFSAEPYPPFTSLDASGRWVGWEVDFMTAICAEAKLDCVITPTAWDGIIPALTSNKIDMIIASMAITNTRLKAIDFSKKYYNTPIAVIAAKGLGVRPTPEGLKGKIIGVQVSTIHEAYVRKHFGATAADIKTYQTQDEANQDLAAGRIDATQASSVAEQAFLDTDQGRRCCESAGFVKDDPEILGSGVGVGFRKGDTVREDKINAAIDAIRANGTYDRISRTYFDFDIYGN